MAPLEHTILYTLPRGIHLGGGKLPVSVLVSPRLMGGSKLGEFPDWLNWTALLKKRGLQLTLRSGTHEVTVPVDTKVLRPELWEAIFKEDTLVRSYQYPDYAGRPVLSYPVRTALSMIKSIYQVAGATLQGGADQEKRGLRTLLDGLQVDWDDRRAAEKRKTYAYYPDHDPASSGLSSRAPSGMLSPDGLLPTYLLAQPGSQAYRDLQHQHRRAVCHLPEHAFRSPHQGAGLGQSARFSPGALRIECLPRAAAGAGVGLRPGAAAGFPAALRNAQPGIAGRGGRQSRLALAQPTAPALPAVDRLPVFRPGRRLVAVHDRPQPDVLPTAAACRPSGCSTWRPAASGWRRWTWMAA